ncbi:ribosomal RNA small subunit methyltransferase A [candidate division WOR-3 bacterium]|nr:ribosomal RNA small subunit methyltransferase A [candidate division WOR-3 bacterium]
MRKRRHSRFSQHFLNSSKIAQRIVARAAIAGKTVIEIGPGKGILTKAMADHAGKVLAIEFDPQMINELSALALPRVRIIHDDFLRHDIRQYKKAAVVGNIPYSISSAIIEKLVREHAVVASATLTVQREFARRLTARPGTSSYGFITLFVNYHYTVCKVFSIAARFFTPRPRVSSTVVHMEKRMPMFTLADEVRFFDFIRGIFRYPRKAVRNALAFVTSHKPIGIDEHILARRPASLDLDDYYALYAGTKKHDR